MMCGKLDLGVAKIHDHRFKRRVLQLNGFRDVQWMNHTINLLDCFPFDFYNFVGKSSEVSLLKRSRTLMQDDSCTLTEDKIKVCYHTGSRRWIIKALVTEEKCRKMSPLYKWWWNKGSLPLLFPENSSTRGLTGQRPQGGLERLPPSWNDKHCWKNGMKYYSYSSWVFIL